MSAQRELNIWMAVGLFCGMFLFLDAGSKRDMFHMIFWALILTFLMWRTIKELTSGHIH